MLITTELQLVCHRAPEADTARHEASGVAEEAANKGAAKPRGGGGGGVQAGSTVASQGAEAVITGNVGPNAHKVLAAANIAIYQAGNGLSVSDALAALKRGELTAVAAPTVSGHWA
jgi:predicted Fe-Mo cluster-binding NifX family protein